MDNIIKRSHQRSKASPFYKNGIGDFIRFRRELEEKYCNRCGKDLTNASRYQWVVHHKNHDRTCNTVDNFEVLCKRCHQLEHTCADNLKLEYTKTCFMCGSSFISRANNAKYCVNCKPIYQKYRHKCSPEQIKQMITEGKV